MILSHTSSCCGLSWLRRWPTLQGATDSERKDTLAGISTGIDRLLNGYDPYGIDVDDDDFNAPHIEGLGQEEVLMGSAIGVTLAGYQWHSDLHDMLVSKGFHALPTYINANSDNRVHIYIYTPTE